MSSDFSIAGRVRTEASDGGRFVSFDDVGERLVEAWDFMWRMPDREARYVHASSVSSLYSRFQLSRSEAWALCRIDSDDYDKDALPKPPPLRSAEVDRMNETLAWVEWVDERDRKLVGMVLAYLHRGWARPPWRSIAKRMGWGGHPDTLAKRYSRALSRIAMKLNR